MAVCAWVWLTWAWGAHARMYELREGVGLPMDTCGHRLWVNPLISVYSIISQEGRQAHSLYPLGHLPDCFNWTSLCPFILPTLLPSLNQMKDLFNLASDYPSRFQAYLVPELFSCLLLTLCSHLPSVLWMAKEQHLIRFLTHLSLRVWYSGKHKTKKPTTESKARSRALLLISS